MYPGRCTRITANTIGITRLSGRRIQHSKCKLIACARPAFQRFSNLAVQSIAEVISHIVFDLAKTIHSKILSLNVIQVQIQLSLFHRSIRRQSSCYIKIRSSFKVNMVNAYTSTGALLGGAKIQKSVHFTHKIQKSSLQIRNNPKFHNSS